MPLDINKVKHLMKQKGINQHDISMMSGVTDAAMSRYLAGNRQPKSETLANMATALGTTSNDLLGLEPPQEADALFNLVARNIDAIPHQTKIELMRLLSKNLFDKPIDEDY